VALLRWRVQDRRSEGAGGKVISPIKKDEPFHQNYADTHPLIGSSERKGELGGEALEVGRGLTSS